MPACPDFGFCAKGLLCQAAGAAELPEVGLIQRIIFRAVATPMIREAAQCQAATAAGKVPLMGAPQRPSGGGHQRVVSVVADRVAALHGDVGSGHSGGSTVQVLCIHMNLLIIFARISLNLGHLVLAFNSNWIVCVRTIDHRARQVLWEGEGPNKMATFSDVANIMINRVHVGHQIGIF